MANIGATKFIRLLETFSEDDLKSFHIWLQAPWFNSNKNIIRLLEKIKKYHPTYDNSKITKEKLFKKILPNGKFSDRRMNNIFSEAYLAAERFIIFQNLLNNQHLQKDLLIKEFQNRNLDEWFFRDTQKEIERLESKPILDWEDHLDLLTFNRSLYHHPNQDKKTKQGGSLITNMGNQVDVVYLLEKAAIINEKIFRNRLFKNENHEVTDEINKWLIVCQDIDHPSINLYRIRFAYTKENMLELFFNLREMFLATFEKLNRKEQNTHLVSLINDSIKLIRARAFDITETLPLYKLGLKHEFLLEKNKLPHIRFASILITSNTKNDFSFSKEMIDFFSKKVDKTIQQDAVFWAKAHTAYYQKKLSEALDFLLNHQFKSPYFLRITKGLTLQIYFDLYLESESYQSYLFNFFDSFERWILREKFSSLQIKNSYLKFVQISRKLAKAHSSFDMDLNKIRKILAKESNIQGTEWLNRKIEKIILLKRGRLKT